MKMHTRDLDQLVADGNAYQGNMAHPEFVAKYAPFELAYDTAVDEDLSPFSDEYFAQQVALYEEIANRKLDQETGELHSYDIEALVGAPNPIGIIDADQMTEHLRSITLMLSLADLKGRARVLDMGAGHGIGSEIMAFIGCSVHAVDIDPQLSELSRRRAAARGFDITRALLNFDDLGPIEDGRYDAAFFSQSLHHCLRPWELIARLKTKLTPGSGIIGFVGEPINNYWWRNWGLRLDETSLFVARSHGWFESGWSLDFIRECFERNGFTLTLFRGGFVGGAIGIATQNDARLDGVLAKAASFGLERDRSAARQDDGSEEDGAVYLDERRYLTQSGKPTTLRGRPAFRQADRDGVLLYGPYIDLDPGTYVLSTIVQAAAADGAEGGLKIEAVSDLGERFIFAQTYPVAAAHDALLVEQTFSLAEAAGKVELRAVPEGDGHWTVSLPTLRRVPG